MLKRNISLLFVAFAITCFVNAQVRPGVKVGYNLSGVFADYIGSKAEDPNAAGYPDNFHMKSGFQIGLYADCPINEAIAIQPGIKFTTQGFTDKYDSGAGSGKVERRFSLYYLQVPVNAQYKLNVGEQLNVVFQAGPYVGYGLFGRQKYTRKGKSVSLSSEQKKITFGNGTADDIHNAFDYGVGAGVGIEFFNFQLMVGYDLGLYKMTFDKKNAKSATYDVRMQNNGFSATLAYTFGRKDALQHKE